MTAANLVDTVLYEASDGVAVITLNRPERLNALLLPGMDTQYISLLHRADSDPSVRAIVVTGAGRGFCSGADLGMLAAGTDALNAYMESAKGVETIATAALGLGTPLVAAINGPCAGLGFVLGISADARFAAPTATFSSTFSRLGLIAEYGSTWLLTRLVGLANASDILLTGRTFPADEALAMGLVNEIVEDPLARAIAWARDLADNVSPTSMAVIKRQLLLADSQSLDEAVELSMVEMQAAFNRPDLPEAIAAKTAKRPVRFPSR